ncbi:MAG TPA: uroporphyrinogen-III C-methyltransferase [Pusillimonas sp.]|uniref:uroporphyrinogen-III C-methyltransferase n=1 Tax=Pusillimonas sp. TaxID=3040095 RepID=UPI002B4B7734|nr:uroporphyrinogen-III C-methyltransferase [Pusillimonas sp.]HLU19417.1 uroporphyrinogen-III C-methyltransferase [Pusillimonas sp.]
MTDTKPDTTSSGATGPDKTNQKKATQAVGGDTKSPRRVWPFIAIVVLLLVAAVLAGAVWYQHRTMHDQAGALLSQAQQSARDAQAASAQAAQALSLTRRQEQTIEQMRAELDDAQQHLQSLEQALQMLTDSGTDIALVNDIDHLVSIAHQQLLLGGNVSNAIIALETAQAQLARANRPNLASLQQAINGDLERLRAVSTVDINRLSSRIDELGRLIESAPMLIPDDASPAVAVAPKSENSTQPPAREPVDPASPWWKQSLSSVANWSRQTWFDIRQDLASFISIRRVDDAAALLMSPEQAGSLRDKLRLRLMTAQVALLMKQPDVWATETRAIVQLLQSRYDINSVEGHRALRLALQLADTSIRVDLPAVSNSQSAIQTLREEHARSSHSGTNGDGAAADADQAAEQSGSTPSEPASGAPENQESDAGVGTKNGGEPEAPSESESETDTPSSSSTPSVAEPDNAETPATSGESTSAAVRSRFIPLGV